MALDGVAIACIRQELCGLLTDGRVDKILQPERDEICLLIRCGGKNHRLILSASSSTPRVHLTTVAKENPEKAPMFCMLLRKHLTSGKVVGFEQPDFERVLHILIESRNELGDTSVKRLIIEIMGRHSNIILVDGDNRVLGSIKHIDFSVSSVRQVIPGMLYEAPPSQGKANPLHSTQTELLEQMQGYAGSADKYIMDTLTGVGPLTAREIAFLSLGDWDSSLSLLSSAKKEQLAVDIAAYFRDIPFQPTLLYKTEEKIWDFSGIAITQYGGKVLTQPRETLNQAVDEFYSTKDLQERMSQKTADLMKFLDNNLHRCQKKLSIQQQKLKDCLNKDQDKQYGDLLMSSLHAVPENAESVELVNYYDEMKPVKIRLKPELSPTQNAQRYYTLYQKAKNAEIMTGKQMELTIRELEYLESVQESLSRAENEKDINDIRDELTREGYHVKRRKQGKIRKDAPSKPKMYTLADGFEVYIGRNNTQNDELTLRMSKNSDLWFHTKNIPGSHTVIRTNGRQPSDDVIVQAAKLCAYNSKAKDSANVPVDYTVIKNVKKPNGAKPGMVIYENYNTVNVKPCPYEEL